MKTARARVQDGRAPADRGLGYSTSMPEIVAESRLAVNDRTYWPELFALSVNSLMRAWLRPTVAKRSRFEICVVPLMATLNLRLFGALLSGFVSAKCSRIR